MPHEHRTALVTCAGLVVFDILFGALGPSWPALLGAAAVAAVSYVVAESLFGVVLVVLLGERLSDAVRHQLPLNSIALPLAVFGAVAGLAALEVGWWAALVMLLPAPLAPELLIVTLPRRLRGRVAPVVLLVAGAVLLSASVLATGFFINVDAIRILVEDMINFGCGPATSRS